MSSTAGLATGIVVAVLCASTPARQAGDPTEIALAVNRAIARGVENLRRGQLADGNWSGQEAAHPGGMTALACFTLVKSGVRPKDEAVARGTAFVERTTFKSTYSQAVRLLLYDALRDPNAWRSSARAAVAFLVEHQDRATGGWAYPDGGVDLSNTQFALLGLRAARRLGLEVPNDTLVRAADGLLRYRDGDGRRWWADGGGFRYWTAREPSGGMTAASLAGLAVLDQIAEPASEVHALLRKHAKTLEASEEWLARRFRVDGNPVGVASWTPGFQFAYLWAVERCAGLSARERIGSHDWYSEGAAWLVDQQKPDGGWGAWTDDTCFALLFLRKATLTESDAPLPSTTPAVARAAVVPPPGPKPDTPYLADWCVAGPFAGEGVDLSTPPFEPAKVRVREKQKVGARVFERPTLKTSGWTDLDVATQRSAEQSLWLLGTHAINKSDQPFDVELWLTVEDGWSVWLDGRRLSFERRVMAPIAESVRVPFALAPGEHALLVIVEDLYGAAAFGARAVAPGGGPLGEKFAATTTPKAKQ
ncbi:MAG: terpene cyclase/mutase family protein [Planctomycetes bacterium]|nr:terpene cyclase/mutase family protein [Planctomycetota bacterium]